MTKLANEPNKEFTFDHNGQVKELLIALGIENCFTQTPPTSPTNHTIQVVEHLFHPTHYILVQLFKGYVDPKENGYYAVCLPKTRYSPEDCQKVLKAIASASDGVLEVGLKWSPKPGHSSN